MSNNQSWRNSLCVEHKKSGDSAPKPVTACKYCERDMCSFHLRPILMTIPVYGPKTKEQTVIDDIIKKSHKGKDGHPCKPYTDLFWKQYDEDKEKAIKESERRMNSMNHGESPIETKPPQPPPQPIPPQSTVKYCPRCGTSMRSSASFCPICGQEQNTKPQEPPPNKIVKFLKDLFGWETNKSTLQWECIRLPTVNCPKCGSSMQSSALFCPKCGEPPNATVK
jgi:hypothetical protein